MKKVLVRHRDVVAYPFELRINIDPKGILELGRTFAEGWSPYTADTALRDFLELMRQVETSTKVHVVERRLCNYLGISPREYPSLGYANYIGSAFREAVAGFMNGLSAAKTSGHWACSSRYTRRSEIFETRPIGIPEFAALASEFMDALHRPLVAEGCLAESAWIDDSPYSVLHAHELARVFPGMKLVHVYRDPRDVLASYQTKKWGGGDVAIIAQRIAHVYQRWGVIKQGLSDHQYIEVRLEDLSAQPKEQLTRLMEFLGMSFDDQILDLDLSKANAGRWRSDLSEESKEQCFVYLQDAIRGYGYELSEEDYL